MFVQYCAELLRDNIFRKHSIFQVGEQLVSTTCVHESRWRAKYGEEGLAGQDLYEDEFSFIEQNSFVDDIRPAFDLAQIDYGRADFAFVAQRPQIYEINTNPHIRELKEPHFPIRLEDNRLFRSRLAEAFTAIDYSGPPGTVDLDIDRLKRQRRHVKRSRYTE